MAERSRGPLRLGVDARNVLHDRRGIGRYVRALLRRWIARPDEVEVRLLVGQPFAPLIRRRMARAIGVDAVRVSHISATRSGALDIVWHPWNGIFFDSGSVDVATIHDVWPFVDAPAEDPALAEHRQRPFLRAAAGAARIITDSRFSKGEIERHLGRDPATIDVVPLGVDEDLVRAHPRPVDLAGARRFVLFVGEAEARKDLSTLLGAMGRLSDAVRAETALVIAGKGAASISVPAGVHVEFAGEVDDDRLNALYASAAAFAFPSRYEGFGLPVLEAMALGAPVVASDAASVPEAGGDAALYFRAGDAQALATQLERVLTDADLARRLRERGKQRASEMTWDRCATRTLEVLKRCVGVDR